MNRTHEWLSRARFAVLAAVVLSAGATAAMSADVDAGAGAPTAIIIRAASADLATPRGAHAAAVRIRASAAAVCGGDVLPLVRTSDDFARCRDAAIDRVVQGANAPLLAEALGRTPARLASGAR